MPRGPDNDEPPPDTQGNTTVARVPPGLGPQATARSRRSGAAAAKRTGGPVRSRGTALPWYDPPPPPGPQSAADQPGDAGPVLPRQARGPPPLSARGDRGARGRAPRWARSWVHAPCAPPKPSPNQSHSDLCKPRQLPVCQPALQQTCQYTIRHTAPPFRRPRTGARGHEREQYGGRTLNLRSGASKARLGVRTREAEGRTDAERPPVPKPLRPPDQPGPNHAPKGGGEGAAPPPPTHPRDAGPPLTHGPTQQGARDPAPGRVTKGPGQPRPELTRRSTEPGQEMWRGTNCLVRPYERPAQ